MPRYRRNPGPPRDHLGSPIEIGDVYFYGAPPTFGKIVAIRGSTIEVEYAAEIHDGTKWIHGKKTMSCRSPEKGICINKV